MEKMGTENSYMIHKKLLIFTLITSTEKKQGEGGIPFDSLWH